MIVLWSCFSFILFTCRYGTEIIAGRSTPVSWSYMWDFRLGLIRRGLTSTIPSLHSPIIVGNRLKERGAGVDNLERKLRELPPDEAIKPILSAAF